MISYDYNIMSYCVYLNMADMVACINRDTIQGGTSCRSGQRMHRSCCHDLLD